jgi:FixJ family two-component response regulator
MPDLTGMELLSLIVKKRPGLPIVFISGYGDIPQAVNAMRAGATDFLTKPIEEKTLLDVVKQALIQEQKVRRDRREGIVYRSRFDSLSNREKEVCALVVEGRLNKQIAAELGISEKTVKVHRGRVMKKVGVESLAELVRVVVKNGGAGIVKPAPLPFHPASVNHNPPVVHTQRALAS